MLESTDLYSPFIDTMHILTRRVCVGTKLACKVWSDNEKQC